MVGVGISGEESTMVGGQLLRSAQRQEAAMSTPSDSRRQKTYPRDSVPDATRV